MADKTGQGSKGRIRAPRPKKAAAARAAAAAAAQAPEHPGVLAAHSGPVTAGECGHPAGRRDPKNPAFCRACGTGGLTPPPVKRR